MVAKRRKKDVPVSGSGGGRIGLPKTPGTEPLALVAALLAVAVVALGIWTIVWLVNAPDDEAPRTAAERALMDAEAAVEADPRDLDARLALARIHIGLGRTETAKRTLEVAEQLDPEDVRVHYLMGLAFLESGDEKRALERLEKAAQAEGGFAHDYAAVWSDIGRARSLTGDKKGAVEAYERALVFAPQAADIVLELAQAYEQSGQPDDAVLAYQGVMRFIPGHPEAADALERLEPTDERQETP